MKIQSLVIILLLFMQVVTPVMATPPTHANIMGDIALYGKIQAEGNTGTMDIKLNQGKIHIKDSVHGKKKVKIYLSAMDYVDGFDGDKFTVTHKNDAGMADGSDVITLTTQDNARGFIIMDMVFSENIIGGFTGVHEFSAVGLSGNITVLLSNPFNVSHIDFNITNGALFEGETFGSSVTGTIASSTEDLTDVQYDIVVNRGDFVGLESDYRSMRFSTVGGNNLPYWIKSTNTTSAIVVLRMPSITIASGAQFLMYYNNSGLISASNISATMLFGDDFTGDLANWSGDTGSFSVSGGELSNTPTTSTKAIYVDAGLLVNTIVESRIKTLDASTDLIYGLGYRIDASNRAYFSRRDSGANVRVWGDGSVYFSTAPPQWISGVYGVDKVIVGTTVANSIHSYNGTSVTGVSDLGVDVSGTVVIRSYGAGAPGVQYIDWVSVRKYIATIPTFNGFGVPLTAVDDALITAAVTGDSDANTYNKSETLNFTLVPTVNISQIEFTSNSTLWGYVATVHWTADTTRVTENNVSGQYIQQVDFTPYEDVDTGWLNATVSTFNISAQEYGSAQIAYFDGINVTSDLTFVSNGSFNLSVDGLVANQTYNATFKYLYNNDPTVGNITNQTCTKGLSCTIPHPTYNDPEGLGHTDFWDYGDGHNGTDGIHAYESSGTYNLSLNTTEVATISPQTIIRNATITVSGFTLAVTVRDIDSIVAINNFTATHESTNIVTTNGTATFTDLAYGPTSVLISSTGYYASAGSIELTQNDSLIVYLSNEGGDYYAPHYVKFRLRSILWHKYTNIDTVVYYAGTAIHTGETDNDGSIGFMLSEDKQYRVTFINATQGISEEVTIYPIDVQYTVIIGFTGIIPDDRPDDDILYGTAKSSINLTTGYVNATFNDTSGTTTLAEFWVNNTNGTNVYYTNTTNSTETFSAMVPGGNATYMTRFKITNTVMNDPLEVVRSVKFNDVVRYSLGLDEGWKYQLIAIVLIFFVGLLGSALNADKMAVIVVLAGWFFIFLGWLTAGASVGGEIGAGLALMLATLLAFGNVVRKGGTA